MINELPSQLLLKANKYVKAHNDVAFEDELTRENEGVWDTHLGQLTWWATQQTWDLEEVETYLIKSGRYADDYAFNEDLDEIFIKEVSNTRTLRNIPTAKEYLRDAFYAYAQAQKGLIHIRKIFSENKVCHIKIDFKFQITRIENFLLSLSEMYEEAYGQPLGLIQPHHVAMLKKRGMQHEPQPRKVA